MSLRRTTRTTLFIWLLLPALSWADNDLLRQTLDALRAQERVALDGDWLLSGRLLAELYDSTGYRLAWENPEQVQALLTAIEAADAEGLRPAELHAETVRAYTSPGALDGPTAAERIGGELRLSDALLRYLIQARFGRLDPAVVNPAWNQRPGIPSRPLVEAAGRVMTASDTSAALVDALPRPFFYADMKRALARYADTERFRGLPKIPGGRNLAAGSGGERVALIRERLTLLGHTPETAPLELETFDQGLRESVIAFQHRFGLAPDGIVGPSTLAALNRPYDESKIQKIRLNLERMRWFQDSLPEDYVLVDVAGFMAHVVRGGEIAWSTRVVVGTPKQQTPSFRDEMEHLVFNPTWTVPKSIQKKMRSVGSSYKVIDRRTGRAVRGGDISNYRRYRLVQKPGPRNALGRVKFMFPNGEAIYMHDTPSKHLFSRRTRAYSHGCVRVKDPLKLAEVILDRPSWDQSEIKRVLRRSRTRYVNLDEHLPVILYYLTAFADVDGQVHFRPDLYGRDAALERAFAKTAHAPRLSFADPLPIPDPPPTPIAVPADEHSPDPDEPTLTPAVPRPTPLPGTTLTRDPSAPKPEPIGTTRIDSGAGMLSEAPEVLTAASD